MHPGEFKNYLLTQYKYILEKEIIPIDNLNKVPSFFKRVIYVFRKIEWSDNYFCVQFFILREDNLLIDSNNLSKCANFITHIYIYYTIIFAG